MDMFEQELEAVKKAQSAARIEANKKKKCAQMKAYREANREKIAEAGKLYREVNKEKVAARQKAYRETNREKIAARQKAYEEANKEKVAAQKQSYRDANKEKIRARSQLRRFRKTTIINHLLVSQRGRCAVCKSNVIEKHHLDHIVPVAKGGNNERSNFQLLCPACNGSKSYKDPLAFMQERGKLL